MTLAHRVEPDDTGYSELLQKYLAEGKPREFIYDAIFWLPLMDNVLVFVQIRAATGFDLSYGETTFRK